MSKDIPKIFIIDDDVEALELMEEYLSDDFHIITASTPEDALRQYNDTLECVLVDYKLGEITGLEMAGQLAKKFHRPTILVTAYGSEKLTIQDYQRLYGVVTKPVDYDVLQRTIRGAVAQYRAMNREKITSREILNNTADAIVTIDESRKITSWNVTSHEIFGRTVEEVKGQDISTLFKHPFEFDYIYGIMERHGSHGQEITGVDANGGEIPLQFTARSLIVEGKSEGFVCSFINISELEDVRKQLSDSEVRLMALSEINTRLLTYLPMAIAVFDGEANLLSCTQGFIDTFELESVSGEVIFEVDRMFNQEQIKRLQKALEGKASVYEGHLEVEGARGNWHRERFNPLTDKDDKVIGAIIIDEDITHQHEKQQQLVHLEKMGALGTLASGVSHEYNNLFTSIYGSAELILYCKPAEEIAVHANRILQTIQRATRLTSQLLNFVSIQELHLNQVDLGPLVEESLKVHQGTHSQEGMEWKVNIEPGLPSTCLDRGLFEEAILVLLSNAQHAVQEQDAKKITLSVYQKDNHLLISVQDSGVGISGDNLKKVFEPFFTTKGALGGSDTYGIGLGLSVADTIIRKHNGFIRVYSEPNKGTEFQINVPIQKRESFVS